MKTVADVVQLAAVRVLAGVGTRKTLALAACVTSMYRA
jgi:hypothetical protein